MWMLSHRSGLRQATPGITPVCWAWSLPGDSSDSWSALSSYGSSAVSRLGGLMRCRRSSSVRGPWLVLLACAIVAAPFGTAAHAGDGGPGALDMTFGQDGLVVTDLGGLDFGAAIAVGSRIVAAGSVQASVEGLPPRDMALVAYQLDGSLDPSFGDGGVVVEDFDEFDTPVDVELDDEGRVLVLVSAGGSSDTRGAVLARYRADGTLDASFGDGGLVDVGTDLYPVDVVLEPDGKIVVAARDPIVLSRYLPDGQPDPGFGESGRVITSLGTPNDWPIALAVRPNGALLVIARTAFLLNEDEGEFDLALLEYRRGGSLDRSFGEEGVVRRHIPDWHIVVDGGVAPNGTIVVLVSAWGGSSFCSSSYGRQTLWRFRRGGGLDTSFGGDGRARSNTLNARGIALQANGRILVMGEGCIDLDDPEMDLAFSLARYRPDGSLDERFGTDGTIVHLIEGEFAQPGDMVLQSNGRALVVGNTTDAAFTGGDLAVARYIAA